MRKSKHGSGRDGLVTAQEIACFAYCPEQWRLQYGLGLEPGNQKALADGRRHHRRKSAAEQLAGGSIAAGRLLIAVAALLVAWLLWGGR